MTRATELLRPDGSMMLEFKDGTRYIFHITRSIYRAQNNTILQYVSKHKETTTQDWVYTL
jgi:hypothetical protein